MKKIRLLVLFSIILSVLLFSTALFSISSLSLSPGINKWTDDLGMHLNLSAEFSPFWGSDKSFFKLSFSLNKIKQDRFTMMRYTTILGTGFNWKPFSIPLTIKPNLLAGIYMGNRTEESNSDNFFGGIIVPRLDLSLALSEKFALGTGVGYHNLFSGNLKGGYISASLHFSLLFGKSKANNKIKTTKKNMKQDFQKIFKKGKINLKITKINKNELQLDIPNILFKANDTKIKPSLIKTFQDVATIIKKQKNISLIVEGHTDNRGSKANNLRLSIQRAKTIKNIFINSGVPTYKIDIKGYGQTKPLVPNNTKANRAKNRRVVIRVITK